MSEKSKLLVPKQKLRLFSQSSSPKFVSVVVEANDKRPLNQKRQQKKMTCKVQYHCCNDSPAWVNAAGGPENL
jgi:hypothetical protein